VIAALLAAAAALTPQVGIAEREWRLSSYVPAIHRGRVTFNVHNYGEDGHNLQVRGPRSFRSPVLPEVAPGANGSLTVRLPRAGTYVLVCTLPGHEARGMRAKLRVR